MEHSTCRHPDHRRDVRARIREVGLRATSARVAVLHCLDHADCPMSHAELMEALEDAGSWNRATVYRNLSDMFREGLLQRHDLGDHVWRFEVDPGDADDSEEGGHPHFMCVECGDVQCLPGLELRVGGEAKAPRAVHHASVEVQLRGVCDDCD